MTAICARMRAPDAVLSLYHCRDENARRLPPIPISPKSFPLRGRCRRRRRKRCRTGSQLVSTNGKTERMTPLPSSGLRGTPDATLPSRGGILRAARSDGRENGTKSAPKSFPSRGRCRRRRRKRCRTEKQLLSTDAEAEQRSPLPSSGCGGCRMPPSPQGEGFCASICSRFLTNRAALLPRSAGLNCC